MPSRTRRGVLAGLGGLAATSGCLGVLTDSGGSDTPAPAADLPTLSENSIEVEDSFEFDEAGYYGWRIDGSYTRAVDLTASVENGHPAVVFLTSTLLSEARVPKNPITHFETPDGVDGLELRDGSGSIVFRLHEPTTLNVTLRAESI